MERLFVKHFNDRKHGVWQIAKVGHTCGNEEHKSYLLDRQIFVFLFWSWDPWIFPEIVLFIFIWSLFSQSGSSSISILLREVRDPFFWLSIQGNGWQSVEFTSTKMCLFTELHLSIQYFSHENIYINTYDKNTCCEQQ